MEDALEKRGYVVGVGSELAVPPLTDAVVVVEYNWHWDLGGRYLEYLDIEFRDPQTKAIIVRAEAHHPSWERSDTGPEVVETLNHCFDKK